ncbi:hypothetical protein BDN71DRAFT_1431248 [Pleurotus eryngii]|uniref:Uncharacterized protein n=1 Tax=Pleurotus eryngii TaxID=5323 RepID=A0A9P5ZWV6_PLEER|nr:hypothetical protein BDN71DRAFT_1431248 [Pleurotus eryngii]
MVMGRELESGINKEEEEDWKVEKVATAQQMVLSSTYVSHYDRLLAYLNAQEIAESHLDAIPKEIICQVHQMHGIPDANALVLLWTMLNMDILMVDKDNDNCQWGHSHYRPGINTMLLTWGSAGSVDMAFQLLTKADGVSYGRVHTKVQLRSMALDILEFAPGIRNGGDGEGGNMEESDGDGGAAGYAVVLAMSLSRSSSGTMLITSKKSSEAAVSGGAAMGMRKIQTIEQT